MKKRLTAKEASKITGAGGWTFQPVVTPNYIGVQGTKSSS